MSRHDLLCEAMESRVHLSGASFVVGPGGAPWVCEGSAVFTSSGNADLLIGFPGSAGMLELGHGDGTFTSVANYAASRNEVTVGDFNGDGKLDLLTTSGKNVNVLLGKGDGTFVQGGQVTFPGEPSIQFVRDINHDGRSDAVVEYADGGSHVSVFASDRRANLRLVQDIVLPGESLQLRAGDFNGDGQDDMVYCDNGGLHVYLGSGGKFAAPVTVRLRGAYWIVTSRDFNNDGVDDLLMMQQTAQSPEHYLLLLGRKGASPSVVPAASVTADTSGVMKAADFNGDGILDLVYNTASGPVVALGAGTGVFGSPTALPTRAVLVTVTIADVNNDGRPDIVDSVGDMILGFSGQLLNTTAHLQPSVPISTLQNQVSRLVSVGQISATDGATLNGVLRNALLDLGSRRTRAMGGAQLDIFMAGIQRLRGGGHLAFDAAQAMNDAALSIKRRYV